MCNLVHRAWRYYFCLCVCVWVLIFFRQCSVLELACLYATELLKKNGQISCKSKMRRVILRGFWWSYRPEALYAHTHIFICKSVTFILFPSACQHFKNVAHFQCYFVWKWPVWTAALLKGIWNNSKTTLIRINRDGEPSRYAKNLDN